MNFGKRLWKRRLELNLSREAVAGAIGTSPQTLWKYEKGLTKPDSDVIVKLSKVLKCSIASLFGESLLGERIDPRAILEAVKLLRERNEVTLEEVMRASLGM